MSIERGSDNMAPIALDSAEDQFLSAAIQDALRLARANGRYEASFHGYQLLAWRESLGARFANVTCVLSAGGQEVARRSEIIGIGANSVVQIV